MPEPRQSPTMVRNMDPAIWERIKVEARRHDLTAGALLTLIAEAWLADHRCASVIAPLESTRTATAQEAPR